MENLNTQKYYHSKDWTNELASRVGLDSLAVRLNSKFAFDLLNECESEYAKTQDASVFSPLVEIETLFLRVVKEAMSEYNNFLHLKSSFITGTLCDVCSGAPRAIE
jgi:hypothetical protein